MPTWYPTAARLDIEPDSSCAGDTAANRSRPRPVGERPRRARAWNSPNQGSQVRLMIARVWRGSASRATADDYQRHYETEVTDHLSQVPGFRGARLLRRQIGEEVTFTSITFFASFDDVRAFA